VFVDSTPRPECSLVEQQLQCTFNVVNPSAEM
jgi:hypothetical protein